MRVKVFVENFSCLFAEVTALTPAGVRDGAKRAMKEQGMEERAKRAKKEQGMEEREIEERGGGVIQDEGRSNFHDLIW